MSGGKAPSSGTNWMDVKMAQDKRDDEQRQREAADIKAAAAESDRVAKFNAAQDLGQQQLEARSKDMVRGRGLNYDDYSGFINQAIQATRGSIANTDANPGQYYTDSIVDKALGRARDERRQLYGSQVSQQFSPGFADKYFTDSSDDRFIDSVLGTQQQNAMSFVNRARDRGQLDNAGYSAALGRINEMASTGRATAQKLGGAVLQGNRTRLADIGNEAKAGAGSYELGQAFSPDIYSEKFNTTLGSLNSSLEGDVRGALEGQKFFDVGDLITRAGAAQGSTNPALDGIDAIAARDKLRNAKRGIGGAGTF